jgi:hypothetical protein
LDLGVDHDCHIHADGHRDFDSNVDLDLVTIEHPDFDLFFHEDGYFDPDADSNSDCHHHDYGCFHRDRDKDLYPNLDEYGHFNGCVFEYSYQHLYGDFDPDANDGLDADE